VPALPHTSSTHLGTVPRSATKRKADRPLDCHKPRILDKVISERLLQILIFGCAYEIPSS
jgi:hypothetical protein